MSKLHSKVIIDGIAFTPLKAMESGSRGREYLLRGPDGRASRVCHDPGTRGRAVLTTSGEKIEYIP